MPVLEVRLDPGESVVAESGELGWVTDSIELQTSTALAGADGVWDAAKRSFGGGSFFMTEYSATTAPGVAVFPARLPGSIINVPLGPEHSYTVQRGGFLAGTYGCELATAFHPGKIGSGLFGGFGFVLQRLSGSGHAWIALGGELSEYELDAGETLRVHPGHVGLLDGTVTYELTTVPGAEEQGVRRRRPVPDAPHGAGEGLAPVDEPRRPRRRARAVPPGERQQHDRRGHRGHSRDLRGRQAPRLKSSFHNEARAAGHSESSRAQGAFLPAREQLLELAALALAELHAGEQAARLGRVVVRDRSLEVLAERARLAELAA